MRRPWSQSTNLPVVTTISKKTTTSRPNLFGLVPYVTTFLSGVGCAFLFLRKPTFDVASSDTTSLAATLPIQSTTSDVVVEKSFLTIGQQTQTDKVAALGYIESCLQDDASCTRPSCTRPACRPWGHFYQTMYQERLGKYTLPGTDPFQFLEIGYFRGGGFDTYTNFFADAPAELHSMEISCLEPGSREDGKWPWGNFAESNPRYQSLLDAKRLHCGDASNVTWLDDIWTTHMHRPDAPPLKIVVDDGSHLSSHMVQTVFFWFPRIAPGGLLVVEDIQPIQDANLFRTQFLPQIMADLHFCGDPKEPKDEPCFPQLYPYLQSIHCEMHICIFERNTVPAVSDLSVEASAVPPNALDLTKCYSFANSFGSDRIG